MAHKPGHKKNGNKLPDPISQAVNGGIDEDLVDTPSPGQGSLPSSTPDPLKNMATTLKDRLPHVGEMTIRQAIEQGKLPNPGPGAMAEMDLDAPWSPGVPDVSKLNKTPGLAQDEEAARNFMETGGMVSRTSSYGMEGAPGFMGAEQGMTQPVAALEKTPDTAAELAKNAAYTGKLPSTAPDTDPSMGDVSEAEQIRRFILENPGSTRAKALEAAVQQLGQPTPTFQGGQPGAEDVTAIDAWDAEQPVLSEIEKSDLQEVADYNAAQATIDANDAARAAAVQDALRSGVDPALQGKGEAATGYDSSAESTEALAALGTEGADTGFTAEQYGKDGGTTLPPALEATKAYETVTHVKDPETGQFGEETQQWFLKPVGEDFLYQVGKDGPNFTIDPETMQSGVSRGSTNQDYYDLQLKRRAASKPYDREFLLAQPGLGHREMPPITNSRGDVINTYEIGGKSPVYGEGVHGRYLIEGSEESYGIVGDDGFVHYPFAKPPFVSHVIGAVFGDVGHGMTKPSTYDWVGNNARDEETGRIMIDGEWVVRRDLGSRDEPKDEYYYDKEDGFWKKSPVDPDKEVGVGTVTIQNALGDNIEIPADAVIGAPGAALTTADAVAEFGLTNKSSIDPTALALIEERLRTTGAGYLTGDEYRKSQERLAGTDDGTGANATAAEIAAEIVAGIPAAEWSNKLLPKAKNLLAAMDLAVFTGGDASISKLTEIATIPLAAVTFEGQGFSLNRQTGMYEPLSALEIANAKASGALVDFKPSTIADQAAVLAYNASVGAKEVAKTLLSAAVTDKSKAKAMKYQRRLTEELADAELLDAKSLAVHSQKIAQDAATLRQERILLEITHREAKQLESRKDLEDHLHGLDKTFAEFERKYAETQLKAALEEKREFAKFELELEAGAVPEGFEGEAADLLRAKNLKTREDFEEYAHTLRIAFAEEQSRIALEESESLEEQETIDWGYLASTFSTDPVTGEQHENPLTTNTSQRLASMLQQPPSAERTQKMKSYMSKITPRLPSELRWDAEKNDFVNAPGFEGRQRDHNTVRNLNKLKPIFEQRESIRVALEAEAKVQSELNFMERKITFENAELERHLATDDIDSAEEALVRRSMAETARMEQETKMAPLSIVMQLMGDPTQMAFARSYGVLGQLEEVLGIKFPFQTGSQDDGPFQMPTVAQFTDGGETDRALMVSKVAVQFKVTENEAIRMIMDALPQSAQPRQAPSGRAGTQYSGA